MQTLDDCCEGAPLASPTRNSDGLGGPALSPTVWTTAAVNRDTPAMPHPVPPVRPTQRAHQTMSSPVGAARIDTESFSLPAVSPIWVAGGGDERPAGFTIRPVAGLKRLICNRPYLHTYDVFADVLDRPIITLQSSYTNKLMA